MLLHGPGEHAPKWLEVIPGLVATHRVIAPDLPGHGASEVTGGPLDRRARARLAGRADRPDLRLAAGPGGTNRGRRHRRAVRDRARQTGRGGWCSWIRSAWRRSSRRRSSRGRCTAFLADPTERTFESSGGAARSISTACARGWASGGRAREPTPSTGPGRPGCRPRCTALHGAVRVPANPAGGAGPDRGADHLDLGPARSRDQPGGGRSGECPVRMASLRDRGCGGRSGDWISRSGSWRSCRACGRRAPPRHSHPRRCPRRSPAVVL